MVVMDRFPQANDGIGDSLQTVCICSDAVTQRRKDPKTQEGFSHKGAKLSEKGY
jgi:hypothetical protein